VKSAKDFLSLLKETKTTDKKAKAVKRSKYVAMQPSSSRRTIRPLSSRSDAADISTPSRLISPTSSRPSRTVSARMSKKSKSRRGELSPRRPRNDPLYLNSTHLPASHSHTPPIPPPLHLAYGHRYQQFDPAPK